MTVETSDFVFLGKHEFTIEADYNSGKHIDETYSFIVTIVNPFNYEPIWEDKEFEDVYVV